MKKDSIPRALSHKWWFGAAITGVCVSTCNRGSTRASRAWDPAKARLEPPTVEVAFEGLDSGAIPVIAETDQGPIHCVVNPKSSPHAAALFVGLTRGRAAWREPVTAQVVTRPLYQNLTFHRAIPGVMIQSGCPVGNGTGSPGYRILVETNSNDAFELSQPGALVLARYTPPPGRTDPNPPPAGHVIGSQFAITLVDMRHLAGEVTVIGRCRDLDVVRRISQLVGSEHVRVGLRSVRVE